jgi:hypothetical protein
MDRPKSPAFSEASFRSASQDEVLACEESGLY